MQTARWVLGYHGCDRAVGEAVLAGETELLASENDWDWLGRGIYFWENSAQRAMEWTQFAKRHPESYPTQVKTPFVVGAVIDLGNCLDLLEAASIQLVKDSHAELVNVFAMVGAQIPTNTGASPDRAIRRLDCAVINYVHSMNSQRNALPLDSVRAAFVEGEPLYVGAGFHARTHIQLCVRKPDRILGYFRVKTRS